MKNKKIFFIILVVIAVGYTASFPKYHPEIKWKEISNDKFIVVFPAGYEETAVYTLEIAGEMYRKLVHFWGSRGRGSIRILLTDVYDFSNGSAAYFPYNHIEIYLFNPPPDSLLGSYREWIHLALSHELTHIVNFNSGSGFTYFLRKILGANPAFYPIMYVPVWAMEGMAIYGESYLNRWGRLDTPDFELLLNSIAGAGKMPDWRDFWGDPTAWPGGTSKYLYGAAFFHFLAQKYGEDKLPEFIRKFTRCPLPIAFDKSLTPIPLTIRKRFQQVFKKDIAQLWAEFLAALPRRDNTAGTEVKFLTTTGKFKKYPIAPGNREVFYVDENYKEFPGIYRLDLKTGAIRRLIKKRGIDGWSYSAAEKKIYFSAVDYYKSFYRCSDIYVLDPAKNNLRRLTKGRRLFYPVKAGAKIYCVKRVKTKSFLCLLDPETGGDKILAKAGAFDSLAFLSLSPDNRYIAASVKTKNKNWRIALFDLEGHLIRTLTDGGAKCYYPSWKSGHELYFVSQYEKNYRLAAFDLRQNTYHVYNDSRVPAVKSFGLLPGGQKAVVSFFDFNGFNLGLVDLSRLNRRPVRLDGPSPVSPAAKKNPGRLTPLSSPGSVRYNFARELLPKYIGINYRYGGSEFQPGFMVSGRDLTGLHSFAAAGFYGFKSKTANFNFNYKYDGFYPTLSFGYSDLSDYNVSSDSRSYIHNERKFQLACIYPLSIKNRRQFYFYSDIHFERVTDDFFDLAEHYRVKLNGIKLAFLFNSAMKYYDSISDSDGMNVSLSYSREFKFMGSDFDMNTVSLDYKQYISLRRPNVLALRVGVSDSWGEAERLVHMGGAGSREGFQLAGNNLFDLMRGYPSGYFTGAGGCIVNLEYRISLLKIERVFFLSRSIERLYLSLFTDIGNLWLEEKRLNPSYSPGIELNLIAFLGDLKLNFSGGIAVGLHPYHSPVFYLRIGNAF